MCVRDQDPSCLNSQWPDRHFYCFPRGLLEWCGREIIFSEIGLWRLTFFSLILRRSECFWHLFHSLWSIFSTSKSSTCNPAWSLPKIYISWFWWFLLLVPSYLLFLGISIAWLMPSLLNFMIGTSAFLCKLISSIFSSVLLPRFLAACIEWRVLLSVLGLSISLLSAVIDPSAISWSLKTPKFPAGIFTPEAYNW